MYNINNKIIVSNPKNIISYHIFYTIYCKMIFLNPISVKI